MPFIPHFVHHLYLRATKSLFPDPPVAPDTGRIANFRRAIRSYWFGRRSISLQTQVQPLSTDEQNASAITSPSKRKLDSLFQERPDKQTKINNPTQDNGSSAYAPATPQRGLNDLGFVAALLSRGISYEPRRPATSAPKPNSAPRILITSAQAFTSKEPTSSAEAAATFGPSSTPTGSKPSADALAGSDLAPHPTVPSPTDSLDMVKFPPVAGSPGSSHLPQLKIKHDGRKKIDVVRPDNDDTINVADYTAPTPVQLEEKEKTIEAIGEIFLDDGWSVPDVCIWKLLMLRGFEALVPIHWSKNFSNFPPVLFAEDELEARIRPLGFWNHRTVDCKAMRALYDLLDTGNKVRDRLITGLPLEGASSAAVKRYVRWTLEDAGYWRRRDFLPALTIISGSRSTGETLLDTTLDELENLEANWRGFLGPHAPLPQLYAVVLCHSVMLFYSLIPEDSSKKVGENEVKRENVEKEKDKKETNKKRRERRLREIAQFDWMNAGSDVWNATAVALLAVHCQRIMYVTTERGGFNFEDDM